MYEALHLAALAPLAVLLVLHDRSLLDRYGLVAAAFSVSWFADSLTSVTGYNGFGFDYVWIPAQILLVLYSLTDDPTYRWLLPWGAAMTAATSLAFSFPGPEVWMTVSGSVAILWLAQGRITATLYLYFGLGTVAYLLMLTQIGNPGFDAAWYAYQFCRVAAFAAFITSVLGERRGHAATSH